VGSAGGRLKAQQQKPAAKSHQDHANGGAPGQRYGSCLARAIRPHARAVLPMLEAITLLQYQHLAGVDVAEGLRGAPDFNLWALVVSIGFCETRHIDPAKRAGLEPLIAHVTKLVVLSYSVLIAVIGLVLVWIRPTCSCSSASGRLLQRRR